MGDRGVPQIVRHAVGYTAATYAVQVVTLVLALVVKRLLGPVNVGIWATLMLLTTYLGLAQMRIADAAQKEISFRRGRGEEGAARDLRDVMFTAWLTLSAALGVAVLAAAALLPGLRAPELRLGLAVVGAAFPVTQALVCYTVMFRAHKRFELLGGTMLLIAGANVALQIPLTYVWGFPGFLAAYAAANLLHFAYWRFLLRERDATSFRLRWHWPTLRRLLAVGVPMQIGGVVNTLFRSLDQVILVGRLGPAALGLYSVGLSVNSFVYAIPNAVSVVTFPSFQERYGEAGTRAALLDLIVVPVRAMALVVLPLAVGGAYLLLPPLVRHVLPDFAPGIAAAQILLLGTFALSLNHMPGQFLITVDRQGAGIAVAAAATAVLAGGVWLALAHGHGIEGVAVATAAAYGLSSGGMLLLALAMAGDRRLAVGVIGECAAALAWTAAAAWAASRLVTGPHPEWWRDFGAAALAIAAYAALVAPLIGYFQYRTGLLASLLRGRRPA